MIKGWAQQEEISKLRAWRLPETGTGSASAAGPPAQHSIANSCSVIDGKVEGDARESGVLARLAAEDGDHRR